MLTWIKKKCFSHLERESQKDNLLLFVFIISTAAGEINVLLNNPMFSGANLGYLTGIILVVAVAYVWKRFCPPGPLFKYVMMISMLGFTILQLYIFNHYPAVVQVLYFNLALSLIYVNGRLILFVGLLTILFICAGHMIWQELFFPWSATPNIPIGIFAETTLVLWAATRIGTSYNLIASSNHQMKKLLKENREQLEIIERQNLILEEYAIQVEQLTLREERQRIAKEMHDTVGHTVTSLILGMEKTKKLMDADLERAKGVMDGLIRTARDGLSEMRENVYQQSYEEKGTLLSEQCRHIVETFSRNTKTDIELSISGEEIDLIQPIKFAMIRSLQESLTNALRHGKATKIHLVIHFSETRVKMVISDNGTGFQRLDRGLGLTTMAERVQSLHGELDITSKEGRGATVVVSIPIKTVSQNDNIRVLIVDDKEFIRSALRILLSVDHNITVVGTAQNGLEALEMCVEHHPDVVLMDIHMPELDGVETTKKMKEKWPEIKVIMLTTFGEIQFAVEAINAGAEGYLLKSNHPNNIAKAVQLVYNGGTLISEEMAKRMVLAIQHMEERKLTSASVWTTRAQTLKERELQILRCLTQGMRYKEISARLNLSEGTVRNYISNIYSKLEVQGREEAAKKAKDIGIV